LAVLTALVAAGLATNVATSPPAHAWQGRMSRVTVTNIHWNIHPYHHDATGWHAGADCDGNAPVDWSGTDELNPSLNYGFGGQSLVAWFSQGCDGGTTTYAELRQSWYRDAQGFDYIDVQLRVTVKSWRTLAATPSYSQTSIYTVLIQPGWTAWVSTTAKNGTNARATYTFDFKQDFVAGDRSTCSEGVVC
jgi:hypothetical protein